jgi:hypothetical protein
VNRPPLSAIIAIRGGLAEIEPVLAALLPQARATGAEVVVVGRAEDAARAGVRLVRVDDDNIFRLRLTGIKAARGEVVAIGEDHAVPRPDWCEAVIRAHGERPEIPAVAGCLVNATTETVGGRGNFLAFAAPYQPPMPELPGERPPPLSALSFKREALDELDGTLGRFEAVLVPRLFAEGRMAADDRIVVDHHQDHGVLWAVVNGFHGARAAYGYLRAEQGAGDRLRQARWSLANWPRRLLAEARSECGSRAELMLVGLVGAGVGLGGAVGSLAGPGRSPERVA